MPEKKSVQTCRRMWKSPSSPPSQEDKYFQHLLRTCTLRSACYSAGHTLTSHARSARCQPLTAPSTHCQVPKMLGWIIFLFFICPSQSCEPLATYDKTPVVEYIPNGEPYFLKCPRIFSEDSYNVTWFKDVSKTNISTDLHTRVYQDNNFLKFLPAKLEDSGFYSCVVRQAESCWQADVQVDVFQNEDGLCYNNKAFIEAQPYLQGSLTIECPSVSDLVHPETAQFNWFKECKPLDLTNKRYITLKKSLIISDVTSQDDGNYTCVTQFIHNGTSYNVSRYIRSSLLEMKVVGKPVIVYPKNNIVDVELGAPFTITCQVLFSENLMLDWKFNESSIDDYFDDGRMVLGTQYEAVNKDGDKVVCQNLTFSSVKEEDYGLKFYCYADLFPALTKAYFMLKKPDPNYQALLIAFFVTATCFIITTIIVVKFFKVDIVLWYRSSCFSHPRQNDGKLYDAYILYPRNAIGSCAYDMDLFVLKLLPEVLEKQCDYRLFIIGRDDLPGQALADLVDEAISQSRRVIVVLGQVSSEANLGEDFERKIAMYDALIRNEVKVILIEMDKITDYSFMPESIKFIRQKQGVVRWKETFTEAALSPNTRFWKNVRYRMPPAPRYSEKTLDYRITEDLLP